MLPARLRRSVCPACRTASRPRSTASPNGSIAHGSYNCSQLASTIGADGSPKRHLLNHETAFNIHNPILITATAAPAASFSPPNRKRLGSTPRLTNSSLEAFPILASGDPTGTTDQLTEGSLPITGGVLASRNDLHATMSVLLDSSGKVTIRFPRVLFTERSCSPLPCCWQCSDPLCPPWRLHSP